MPLSSNTPERRLPLTAEDQRWLAAAAAIAERGCPLSRPNPAVGAVLIKHGRVIARGWTQPGGRPHAEAMALAAAGTEAAGATLYVTLEPCAHASARGPDCAGLVAGSGVARVVIGCGDPDPRTAGAGIARLRTAGIAVTVANDPHCAAGLAGYLVRTRQQRPHVSLKLALSDDCCLARPSGQEQWLTGPIARAHVHALRARMDAILVGGGTLRADAPKLDVRLPGLAARSPARWLLTRQTPPPGWQAIADPREISAMPEVQWLMVEGGAQTARSFLAAGLVDRLLLYRAPLTLGGTGPALPELAQGALASSGKWRCSDSRQLGKDRFEVYDPD